MGAIHMKFLVYACGVMVSSFGAGIAINQGDILWAAVSLAATVGIACCVWMELK